MRTYHGDQDIEDTGIDGDENTSSTSTDYPEFASSNTGQYGINKAYFYAFARGEQPHPFVYMTTGITNNAVLHADIRSVNATPGQGYRLYNNNIAWFTRMVAGAVVVAAGDIQRINIALKCIGFSGIPTSPLRLYSSAQAAGTEPGWGLSTILNPGSGGFGEINELAKDDYGVGGTNSLYGYIYSSNTSLPPGVTVTNPIVGDSRNTHPSVTSRGTGNNRLGIPYAVGKHNRIEYIELKLKEVLDYLNLASDPEPYQALVESPDSRTIRLHTTEDGHSSNVYTSGNMDDAASNLYPVATLSAVTAGGRLDVALTLRREPTAGIDVVIPVDDQGAVDWSASAMANHFWKVSVNGHVVACTGVEQTLISGSYVALWKLYIRNVNTSAPASGQISRSPAIMEEYGTEFYLSTSSTGVTEITFKTSAGKEQNGRPAEFYKRGKVHISSILIAGS